MSKTKPIPAGTRFTRLVVIRPDNPYIRRNGVCQSKSLCRCDCGKYVSVVNMSLRAGLTMACGCLGIERRRASKTIHGRSGTRTFWIWCHMIERCTNKKNRHYGGRGISVCERWSAFTEFFKDMGEAPPEMTLGRIDNNGNYCPDNCRWETVIQQARNRRDNKVITFNGITGCISEICEKFGRKYGTVQSRLKKGWTVDQAMEKIIHRKVP